MAVNKSLLPKISLKIALRSLAIASLLWFFLTPVTAISGEIVDVDIGQSTYQLELAITPAQRRQGLMYRQQLDPRQGMLLVYSRAGDHRIWMKNMAIALRVFWIDDEYTVIKVQRLEPCSDSPCAIYSAPRAARFILELGDYDHALGPGDKIEGLARL